MLDGALVVDDQRAECAVLRRCAVLRQTMSADQDIDLFSLDDDGHTVREDTRDPESLSGTS